MSKDLNQLKTLAENQGWDVSLTSGGHLRWDPPDKRFRPVFSASTPSDYRALNNIKSRLKRAGLQIP